MRYSFLTADVFTDRQFGGNQLAVFPDGQGLSSAQMQSIAREFNYSETVFVLPPDDPAHTCRLRIFTPGEELPFAGHPTIGTAFILTVTGKIVVGEESTRAVFEEGAGPVPVTIRGRAEGDGFYAQLTAPRLPEYDTEPPSVEDLARVLQLSPDQLMTGLYCPEAVSCGVPFLFVPLRSLAAVRQASIDKEAWREVLSAYWTPQIYPFSFETESPGVDIHARMFAPGLGVEEDPATGSAAAALAGYLAARDERSEGTRKWTIEQGLEIGRPSRLDIEADKQAGAITAIRVGGSAVAVMRGELELV